MEEILKKEFKIGNTTIIVHSKLAIMSDEERSEWWQREYDRGNPVVLKITEAIDDCYADAIHNGI